MPLPKPNPTHLFFIIQGGRALFDALGFTVNLIDHAQTVGLNPPQLALVGTVLELTAFLFEAPTGAASTSMFSQFSKRN